MAINPFQDFLSQIKLPFVGNTLMRKYENEKSPLRSELFSTYQLEQYAVTLANTHEFSVGLFPDQLLKRLDENEGILIEVRNFLIESVRGHHPISPAGEWLLDNFYMIEEQIQIGKKHFPRAYSDTLPRLSRGPFTGLPRVYHIVLEIIAHSDGRIDLETLSGFVHSYQKVANLNLGELWAIPIMLRLALIENLRRLAATIASDMINKNLAGFWADRMTKTAETDPKSLIIVTADMARSNPPMVSSFVAELTRRLLGKGPALTLPLTWIEQRLSENGLTTNTLVYLENQKQAADQLSISNSIGSLRFVNNTDWREFVENNSLVEQILRQDIDGIYERMDFRSRDFYRHRIEALAKGCHMSELDVALKVVELARTKSESNNGHSRVSHVGYYLMDKGLRETEKCLKIRHPWIIKLKKVFCAAPFGVYAGSVILITIILSSVLVLHAYRTGFQFWGIAVFGILSLLAVSHIATALINWLTTLLVTPDFLPRMDYSKGIPEESRTLVAIPALFSSISEFDNLVESMEVRYLANKQENLHFALLTDFHDAQSEILPEDKPLLEYAEKKFHELNKKYRGEKQDMFYFLHRPRKWNSMEKVWMGYERKRGKLGDLNALIQGNGKDKFIRTVGDIHTMHKVRYVITLDADTQLPREAAWKIVSTIAHPLNRAQYDTKKTRITQGYGILQPLMATSLPHSAASWYARIYGSEPGIDPYTRAVSDVYQDIAKEGSFIGKGIYDVEAFEKTMRERFPENRVLSHDLLEGCHARSGLISDVQLFEEYPSSYLDDMKRRHRWIRGDLQIGVWLFPRVPAPGRRAAKNPLSALSRWKILDNLRRILVHPALLFLLLAGWLISDTPLFWTITVIGILIPPAILAFVWNLLKKPDDVSWAQHSTLAVENLVNQLIQHIWTIVSLPYEAYINLDAIVRTTWRIFISHKYLLQWNPSTNRSGSAPLPIYYTTMWFAPSLGFLLLLVLPIFSWPAFIIASPILLLWIISPFIAWWISLPQPTRSISLSLQQNEYLRKLARKTWAYFENFTGLDDHVLPPDNYQENPQPKIAQRTSPTNIGITLLSTLAAHDFGYVTIRQLLDRCTKTFGTLQQLERYHGHFYNWYDTQSLMPLPPRYVSTVDSGNLAASLLTLKEGLLSLADQPVLSVRLYRGLLDTLYVLSEKTDGIADVKVLQEIVETSFSDHALTAAEIVEVLDNLMLSISEFSETIHQKNNEEIQWWINTLQDQCEHAKEETIALTGWMSVVDIPPKFGPLTSLIRELQTLGEIAEPIRLREKIELWHQETLSDSEAQWLNSFQLQLSTAQGTAVELLESINTLTHQAMDFADYEYDFLFDPTQQLFSIGYNVEEHRRDHGFYDLLGSEARLGIYVAIAQGKIPQNSWFALGRQLTHTSLNPVLISWSGSVFEYLMPLLVTPTYAYTLLDQTYMGVVRRQIEYGQKKGLPWGISESCFNMVHANMDYQYRAFGVPGLGLKRGLGDDYVVAPYAAMMALMIAPDEASENLREMSKLGFEGRWGFYEAIDYTSKRLQRGQAFGVVKAYMTHHQGMGFLSLAYLLLDRPMQKRFESELQFKTSLLLLQEKVPTATPLYVPALEVADVPEEPVNTEWRVIHTPHTSVPEVQLLSNGSYHVMISNAGGGYSRWNNLAITRWREDGTCDNRGTFCFIRDMDTLDFWSTTHQPVLKPADHYEVIFSQGRAEFRRRDFLIDAHTEIVVSPEDDVEIRRLLLTNRSKKHKYLEITSYTEVVINEGIAEMLHPAFSNLFVQTEIIPERDAIVSTRRPRSTEERPSWMFHMMKVHDRRDEVMTFETNRDHFIGRGHTLENPRAMTVRDELSGSEGSVLDPIAAIRYRVHLKPHESIKVDMVFGIGRTREECQALIAKFQDKHMIDRAFELAWTHSHVVLKQINATPHDAALYCRLAGSIIYANASLRAEPGIISKNMRGQSGLWSHSISGDWPIVLVQIEDNTHFELVEKLVQAHAYWRQKGLMIDLVIWNEDHGGYRQLLQNQILSLITPTNAPEEHEKPGGIFVRSADQLSNEDRILFQAVARVIITDKFGTLEGQLNRRTRLKPNIPKLVSQKNYAQLETPFTPPADLMFYNGLGGFSQDGSEYVVITSPEQITPAPWSNVLSNPHFGTVISESGQSYTWFQNAHELRLTPWNNDPLTDLGGEHFYIRDEESGQIWSPTPLPARGQTPYITRHGFGYSVFEHTEDGIRTEMKVFVDAEKPIKYTAIKLYNQSGRPRKLSVTGYVEWVLGDLRHKTMMHIITDLELDKGAILARNSYSTEFGHLVAFFDVNDRTRMITTDREEFIGRNGTVRHPEGLTRSKLSGKTGAALDPCGVIQVTIDLEDGEDMEYVFRLGTGMHLNDIEYLIRQGRGRTAAREAFQKVNQFWKSNLSVIRVETPEQALNILANGWLNYQTLACRLWARSGYYQSGGAFGFRDQLQDVLSLLHNEPTLARSQILLCASRQFVEGDVQHWWHPPVGRGVRTRCSDDYLWLPFVTARYLRVTGDTAILDEDIRYIESRLLAEGEDSYYDLPLRSESSSSLYDHCKKALEYGMRLGTHGLPLMGSGDWNDGMDRVGTKGKGESVWLAFFLYHTMEEFQEIIQFKQDSEFLDRCSVFRSELASNIDEHAWDGKWYRRAYFDDGTPLGSALNTECSIDSIAQSWSIISGAGKKDKSEQAMLEAEKQLVRPQEKIIQLFTPPFDQSDLNPGYIKGYVPGVRENGGQYTHAAIWMIMAFALMREKTKMGQLLRMINPILHGITPKEIAIYKVEPYVVAADIYAVSQHTGRGGWTWYTGSAGWLYQLIIEYVLGIQRRGTQLFFTPCLPYDWERVTIVYRYLNTLYNIEMIQQTSDQDHITVFADKEKQPAHSFNLVDDETTHHIDVLIKSEPSLSHQTT